jgi:hypothetical protein
VPQWRQNRVPSWTSAAQCGQVVDTRGPLPLSDDASARTWGVPLVLTVASERGDGHEKAEDG